MCADLCSAHIFLISERGAYPLFKPSQVGIAALSVAFGAVQALASVAVFVIDFDRDIFFQDGTVFFDDGEIFRSFPHNVISPFLFILYSLKKKNIPNKTCKKKAAKCLTVYGKCCIIN